MCGTDLQVPLGVITSVINVLSHRFSLRHGGMGFGNPHFQGISRSWQGTASSYRGLAQLMKIILALFVAQGRLWWKLFHSFCNTWRCISFILCFGTSSTFYTCNIKPLIHVPSNSFFFLVLLLYHHQIKVMAGCLFYLKYFECCLSKFWSTPLSRNELKLKMI